MYSVCVALSRERESIKLCRYRIDIPSHCRIYILEWLYVNIMGSNYVFDSRPPMNDRGNLKAPPNPHFFKKKREKKYSRNPSFIFFTNVFECREREREESHYFLNVIYLSHCSCVVIDFFLRLVIYHSKYIYFFRFFF